jgi:hypothetical protein
VPWQSPPLTRHCEERSDVAIPNLRPGNHDEKSLELGDRVAPCGARDDLQWGQGIASPLTALTMTGRDVEGATLP